MLVVKDVMGWLKMNVLSVMNLLRYKLKLTKLTVFYNFWIMESV